MKQVFGILPDGREVLQYTITDGVCACEILSWGAAVRAIRVPDREGNLADVVLGFDSMEDYLRQTWYIGAIVGRYANRIGGASFPLEGKTYPVAKNDGENHLHGGLIGFDKKLWTVEEAAEDALTLSLVSPDMEEGYPGTLKVQVRYTLKNGALRIDYRAETDKPTLCNLTNHCYFNLDGQGSGDVLSQTIKINATRYTPTDAGSIPTGELAAVEGTPMDLREETEIGLRIDEDFVQLRQAGGYDHNWVPDGAGLREVACAKSEKTGITLRVETDQPGLQFYSGNYLDGSLPGKGGKVFGRRSGFCLETQNFPDAPHHKNFPSAELHPGEIYETTTVYRFIAE